MRFNFCYIKLISRKIGWQINYCVVDLNFTFWKFLEHSALFGNQKFKYARCQKFIISGFYVKVIFLFQGIWQHWQVLATICYKYMWCVSNAFLSLIKLHFLSCTKLIVYFLLLRFLILQCLVGKTIQCGNVTILLPFRFYVKSTFENAEVLKLPF